jgi:TrmH family RNA methyltransferase
MNEKINSKHNEKIRFIDKLKKPSHRKKFGLFPVEGLREISRAQECQLVRELLFCEACFSHREESLALIQTLEAENIPTTPIATGVYQKMSLRDNGDGLLAIAQGENRPLNRCTSPANGLFIALENIEKPSNFGAIVRTAESAGVDGIIVLDHSTEIFSPNAIRNSQVAVLFAKIYTASREEFLAFSEQHHLTIYITSPRAQRAYYEEDFRSGSVILVGAEDRGVGDFWLQQNHQIRIPQRGQSDSLNVSVAAAIVLYECIRQRSIS